MGTILVVDDDSDISSTLKELFESEGHRVVSASSGELGLRCMERERFDLVLLDFMMPGKDGRDVLRDLARRPSCTRPPVVLMSAVDASAIAAEHACSLLRKPFEVQDVLTAASRALRDAATVGLPTQRPAESE